MPPAAAPPAQQRIVITLGVFPDPALPVIFPAGHPLVLATAFLEWIDVPAVPVAVTTTLSTSQVLRAFGRRLRFPSNPLQQPANIPGPLQLAFTAAAWIKYIQELLDSGLLAAGPFGSLPELDDAIDGLTILSVANLTVLGPDLFYGEPTVAVAAVAARAAQPARPAVRAGRGAARRPAVPAVPAVAAVAGRPALDPQLQLFDTNHTGLTVLQLEIHGVAPWATICFLAGALGPCLTQAARNAGGSAARLTANSLITGIGQRFGVAAADLFAVCGELAEFLESLCTTMPYPFRAPNVRTNFLRAELRDSVIYCQSRENRTRVETDRIQMISARCDATFARIAGAAGCVPAARCLAGGLPSHTTHE